jgi:hypothetical protein
MSLADGNPLQTQAALGGLADALWRDAGCVPYKVF